jgi:hypothetical protein
VLQDSCAKQFEAETQASHDQRSIFVSCNQAASMLHASKTKDNSHPRAKGFKV